MSWLAVATERANAQVSVGWQTRIAPVWAFDLDAIGHAARERGITWPIVVGCAEYPRGQWGGMHDAERIPAAPGWRHRISVRRAGSDVAANRTLWHELAHCEQAERLGVEWFHEDYMRYGRKGAGYRTNPYEIEAREWEKLAAGHPLVIA